LIGITNIFIELFVGIVGLLITVWIIKNRFSTTIPRSIGVYISSIICIVGLALFVRAYFVQAYKIPAGSMKQSLLVGDHILVNKFIYKFQKPQKGDIIVFKFPPDPEKDFIKRVIGVAGDVIECRDKKLYVNHEPVNHDYGVYTDPHIIPAKVRPRDNFGPITVPKDSLFVMGDNRDESFDSRFWGFVDLKAVNGKAFVIYWSLNQTNAQVRFNRIGKTL
jgi:signal peptidase I